MVYTALETLCKANATYSPILISAAAWLPLEPEIETSPIETAFFSLYLELSRKKREREEIEALSNLNYIRHAFGAYCLERALEG